MVWYHDTGYEPAYDHGGLTLAQLTDGTEHQADFIPTGTDAHVTGFLAGCACGWRGPAHLRSQVPDLTAEDAEDMLVREWTDHVYDALPELELHEVLNDTEAADPVAQAVRTARAGGAPWARIGAAAGTSRQAAWERWHHLEPAPDALPGDLRDGADFDSRRVVLALLTNRPDDKVDPRSATDWNAAYEGYLRMERRLAHEPGDARAEGYAQGREDALREHTQEHESSGSGRPTEVTALLHTLERLRDQWHHAAPQQREALWAEVTAAADRTWDATETKEDA